METIKVNTKELSEFLKLIARYGNTLPDPYIVDAAMTLHDQFFGEGTLLKDIEEFSKGDFTEYKLLKT